METVQEGEVPERGEELQLGEKAMSGTNKMFQDNLQIFL